MKIVFISNFMNHHQLPVAEKLYEMLGDDYKFIALEGLPEERRTMGYADMNHQYKFVLCAYDSPEQQEYADKIALECDVLIAGSCPDWYIKRRVKANKITIKTSERYFKENKTFFDQIKHYVRAMRHLSPFQNKPLYFLCASAYTSQDVNKYTDFHGKTYKWGYFPEVKHYDDIEKIIEWKHHASILWVSRLIEWKHPEVPIMVAKHLKSKGLEFQMNLIGNGELENKVKQMIIDDELDDCVHMLGSMNPEDVRKHMEQSEIFLFTSDQNEGWGAVVNEAMNSACAVVANHEIGSVPYLIKHAENGFAYDGFNDCLDIIEDLLVNTRLCKKVGHAAYQSIISTWNANVASERLIKFINEIATKKECGLFLDGPCSSD